MESRAREKLKRQSDVGTPRLLRFRIGTLMSERPASIPRPGVFVPSQAPPMAKLGLRKVVEVQSYRGIEWVRHRAEMSTALCWTVPPSTLTAPIGRTDNRKYGFLYDRCNL
ncbi:hypothetical protein BHM03_00000496 [Ensete ventricosum]|nr:hypothetical protein BHM03_00000496 [Ensete ventricosum]